MIDEFLRIVLEENYAQEYWPGPDGDEPPKAIFQVPSAESLNEGLLIDPSLAAVVEGIPVVPKAEFLQNMKPLDVWVTLTPPSMHEIVGFKPIEKAKSLILAMGQRSPFTSAKLVMLNGKDLIGFNVNPETIQTNRDTVMTYPAQKYMELLNKAVLCRIPALTSEEKQRAAKYIWQKRNLEFSKLKLVQSAWNRLIKVDLLKFNLKDPETLKLMRYYRESLFCSSLIALAFTYAQRRKLFPIPTEAWPKDFIMDDKIEKICRIDF